MHYMQCKSDYFKEARTFAWKIFCEKMKPYIKEETMIRIIWIGIQKWIYNDFEESLPKGNETSNRKYVALQHAFEM